MISKIEVKIYDSYLGRVIPFSPLVPGEVSIYYCGPTVYNHAHIGNFRPVIFFDLVHRFFKELGYKVDIVSNYTDIDDKIIAASQEEMVDEKTLADRYIASYESSLAALNVLPLTARPRVSSYIENIVEFIEGALDKNVAYASGDDIYFSVSAVGDYGSLSKVKIEELDAGKRIAVDSHKRSPLDFVLWKKTRDQGVKYHAPFGDGRPGWHTECLVMIDKIFNRPLVDIHGGGFDLKFPHHENERAQAEAVFNSPLARCWMHVGFLNMGAEKMSKSLGNVIYMKDFLKAEDPDVYRLFSLKGYYRAPLVYSVPAVESSSAEIRKYLAVKKAANLYLAQHAAGDPSLRREYYDPFLSALGDDFNVPNALVYLDRCAKTLNQALRRQSDTEEISSLSFTFNRLHGILGLRLPTVEITPKILEICGRYEKARAEKDYDLSDTLRKQLTELEVL